MKLIFKILGIALLLALIALFLSCGARKANKSHSKEETKTELTDNSIIENKSETNVKTTTTVNVDDKNETITEETTISPQDNTKEAFIIEKDGTKTIFNNLKKTVKKTTQKNNTKTQSFGNSEQLKKDDSKEQKAVKQLNTSKKENSVKNVERNAIPWYYWLLFLIPVLVIYFSYRLYKKLPIVPKL